MGGLDICGSESGVDIVQVGGRVLAAAKDGAAIYVVKDNVEFVRLIWEAPIIQENIRALTAPNLTGYPDWLNRVARGAVMEGKRRWVDWSRSAK